MDWKEHKGNCIAYKLERLEDSEGLFIMAPVARRNIAEGQVIFSELPLLTFPLTASLMSAPSLHVMDLPCMDSEWFQPCDLTYSFGLHASRDVWSRKDPKATPLPCCMGCLKRDSEFNYKCSKCTLPLCSATCEDSMDHRLGECDAITRCSSLVSFDEIV